MKARHDAGSEPSLRWRLVRAVVLSRVFLFVLDAIAFALFFFLVAPAIGG